MTDKEAFREPIARWTAGIKRVKKTTRRTRRSRTFRKIRSQPYWQLARQYVLADRMFSSNLDGSFVAHQYAVAGYSDHAVDWPIGNSWGCEGGKTDTLPTLLKTRAYGPRIRACFDIPTLADEADAAGVSWRFYASGARPRRRLLVVISSGP